MRLNDHCELVQTKKRTRRIEFNQKSHLFQFGVLLVLQRRAEQGEAGEPRVRSGRHCQGTGPEVVGRGSRGQVEVRGYGGEGQGALRTGELKEEEEEQEEDQELNQLPFQEMMEYKARGCKPLEEVNNVAGGGGMMGADVGMGGDDHDDDDDGDDD